MPELAQNNIYDFSVSPISEETKIEAIVKAVVRTSEAWNLSNLEASQLFDVPIATWNRMKSGNYRGRLDQDKVTRASLILGIFKGLRLLFNGPLTYGWVTTNNTGVRFNGQKPIEIMIGGGIPAMFGIRQHIDALRGGL